VCACSPNFPTAPRHTDPDARRGDANAALELARRQGACLFELRSALDDFELRGEPARVALLDAVERMRADGTWPELTRARRAGVHEQRGN
jgi:hypothetical protein